MILNQPKLFCWFKLLFQPGANFKNIAALLRLHFNPQSPGLASRLTDFKGGLGTFQLLSHEDLLKISLIFPGEDWLRLV